MRRILRPLAGVILAVFFLWLTYQRLDWRTVRELLVSVSIGPLFAAVCVLAVDFLVRIFRWWRMLQVFEPELPLRNCVGPFLASFAVNNVLPLRAGDLFRSVGFRLQLRSPAMRIFGTVIIERLLDVWVLFGFLFLGLLSLPTGGLPSLFVKAAVSLALVSLFAALVLLTTPQWIRGIFKYIEKWPALCSLRLLSRVRTWTEEFIETLVMLKSPMLLSQLFGLSMVVWMLEGAIFAIVARALTIDAGVFGPWFALATGTLGTILPSTPGHIGTFDYFATVGLMAYGAKKEMAVVFSLLVHLVLWVPITCVGGLYLVAPQGRALWRRVHLARGGDDVNDERCPSATVSPRAR